MLCGKKFRMVNRFLGKIKECNVESILTHQIIVIL